MGINKYYENLIFDTGTKINVSRQVDANYFDMLHWHPDVEILVSLCEGNEVTVNFNKYRLQKNDVVIVYSGDLHSVHYVTKESFLIIQFPIGLLALMGELNGLLPRLTRYNYIRNDPDDARCAQILEHAHRIEAYHYSGEPFREVHCYVCLLELFTCIGGLCVEENAQNYANSTRTEQANMRLMAEACLYISENCTKPLLLGETASKVGISKSHFAHLFKEYTNMTFIDFLTVERIKMAESLFPNPKLHIIDIAFESGFTSISSFNRAFRKVKGCTPTEFRTTMIP